MCAAPVWVEGSKRPLTVNTGSTLSTIHSFQSLLIFHSATGYGVRGDSCSNRTPKYATGVFIITAGCNHNLIRQPTSKSVSLARVSSSN